MMSIKTVEMGLECKTKSRKMETMNSNNNNKMMESRLIMAMKVTKVLKSFMMSMEMRFLKRK